MPTQYPYNAEPSHDTGAAITLSAANAGRTTATSSAEQRLIVDAVDQIGPVDKELFTEKSVNSGEVQNGQSRAKALPKW